MVIIPGGKIKQGIMKDEKPGQWDYSQARLLNIQILNSVAFKAITRQEPPKSPITIEEYTKFDVPFLYYAEANFLDTINHRNFGQ